MSKCREMNCVNAVSWIDISIASIPQPGYCYLHSSLMSPARQEGLRNINTGEPYLEPVDPDDLVDYDNPSLVGPQHWPPPGKKVEEKIILSAKDIGDKKVGDNLFCQAGAPGVGHVIYKITRIDENWVHGFVIENTVRVLDPDEVI